MQAYVRRTTTKDLDVIVLRPRTLANVAIEVRANTRLLADRDFSLSQCPMVSILANTMVLVHWNTRWLSRVRRTRTRSLSDFRHSLSPLRYSDWSPIRIYIALNTKSSV